MNNKGQMSTPLSLIFGIIIGSVIFMFLIGFGYQYIALSGSLGSSELVIALNDEFAAFSVSESAEKTVDYKRKLNFQIVEGQLISKGQGVSIDQIIYAPPSLEGKQIAMATKSLELPYRIGNVFYLADGKTVYILVSDKNSEEVVDDLKNSFNSIPSNFPSEVFSIDQVRGNVGQLSEITAQYDHVRFVFFTSYDSVIDDISANFDSYDVLRVTSQEEDYSYGNVEYPDGKVIYMSYPMLVGAIIAFDSESYNYNLDLILDKLSVVTGIYYEKSKYISARLPTCDYARVKTNLENYRRFIGTTESPQSYKLKVDAVEEANKGLGGDCPEVF
mgnify:CR=1 FL=1